MTTGHAPTELVADYAAGKLSPGMTLLIASHLTWCPACRDKAARLEALCGALLADAEAVDPAPRCLRGALARIDAPEAPERAARDADAALPRPLCRRLTVPLCDLRWRPVLPGLSSCALDGFEGERVGLMRGRPGVCMRASGPSGGAGTLVLAGQLRDGARTYDRGDLALPGKDPRCRPEVVGHESCLCLVVQPANRPAASGD